MFLQRVQVLQSNDFIHVRILKIDYHQYRESTGRHIVLGDVTETPHPDPNTEQQVCQTSLRAQLLL